MSTFGESRTHMPFQALAFETSVYAIPPRRLDLFHFAFFAQLFHEFSKRYFSSSSTLLLFFGNVPHSGGPRGATGNRTLIFCMQRRDSTVELQPPSKQFCDMLRSLTCRGIREDPSRYDSTRRLVRCVIRLSKPECDPTETRTLFQSVKNSDPNP